MTQMTQMTRIDAEPLARPSRPACPENLGNLKRLGTAQAERSLTGVHWQFSAPSAPRALNQQLHLPHRAPEQWQWPLQWPLQWQSRSVPLDHPDLDRRPPELLPYRVHRRGETALALGLDVGSLPREEYQLLLGA